MYVEDTFEVSQRYAECLLEDLPVWVKKAVKVADGGCPTSYRPHRVSYAFN